MLVAQASLTPQAVETEEHCECSVVAVVLLRGKQEDAEFGAVEASCVGGMNLGSTHILRRVGSDSAVDVGVAVETADGRQAPVDRRCRQPVLLHPAAVQLNVRPYRGEHGELVVGGPLEAAEIMPIGIEGAPAAAGEEGDGSHLRVVDDEVCSGRL